MIKIYDMETLEEREILFRGGSGADVSAPVAEILRAVQERGDAALREYTLRFDGAAPDALVVTAEEVDQAAAQVEPAWPCWRRPRSTSGPTTPGRSGRAS